DGCQNVLDTLRQVQQSHADVARVQANPMLSAAGRSQQSQQIFDKVFSAAQAALDALNQTANDVLDKLSAGWKSGKRTTVDGTLLTAKTSEIQRYLLRRGGSSSQGLAMAAAALYDQMLDRPPSDEEAYYCRHALSYNMGLFFADRGVDPAFLNQQMALVA